MVYVPENISRKFEEAASANTRRNVETCAILAGKLVHTNHTYKISYLICIFAGVIKFADTLKFAQQKT